MLVAQLSEEEYALLNPAYVGFLLFTMVSEYIGEHRSGMDCALPFVLLPIMLDTNIAVALPRNKKASLIAWISEHQGELGDFAELVKSYRPVVVAAISFLLEKSVLVMDDKGKFQLGSATVPKAPALFFSRDTMRSIARRAGFLGRWFANSPSIETLYAQLGVRP